MSIESSSVDDQRAGNSYKQRVCKHNWLTYLHDLNLLLHGTGLDLLQTPFRNRNRIYYANVSGLFDCCAAARLPVAKTVYIPYKNLNTQVRKTAAK